MSTAVHMDTRPGLNGPAAAAAPSIDSAGLTSAKGKEEALATLSPIIAKHLGLEDQTSTISTDRGLETLGLDSIGAVQLSEQLQSQFSLEVHPDELFGATLTTLAWHIHVSSLKSQTRIENAVQRGDEASLGDEPRAERLGSADGKTDFHEPGISEGRIETLPPRADPSKTSNTQRQSLSSPSHPRTQAYTTAPSLLLALNPLDALAQSNAVYPSAAKTHGFNNYWETVAPLQNDIVIAYITEALTSLGCDLSEHPNGVEVPPVLYISKYERLMDRLWGILDRRYIVQKRKGKVLRGSDRIDVGTSGELIHRLRTDHPRYECEARLLEVVGPRLADCLSGKTEPIKVLFGSVESRDIMATFYATCPMMATHMDQVLAFFHALVHEASRQSPLKILEVGAGTGGTTSRLVDALTGWMAADESINVEYTFTDIGPSFVTKAKQRWKHVPLLTFSVYDIEQDPPETLKGQYDIVLGANVVHATADRTATCRRLGQTLKPGGILVLSEVTTSIDWYDICFGLLDGWWLSDGGKGYAIQPASVWMNVFARAGYEKTGHSGIVDSEEADTQQLLMAQKGDS